VDPSPPARRGTAIPGFWSLWATCRARRHRFCRWRCRARCRFAHSQHTVAVAPSHPPPDCMPHASTLVIRDHLAIKITEIDGARGITGKKSTGPHAASVPACWRVQACRRHGAACRRHGAACRRHAAGVGCMQVARAGMQVARGCMPPARGCMPPACRRRGVHAGGTGLHAAGTGLHAAGMPPAWGACRRHGPARGACRRHGPACPGTGLHAGGTHGLHGGDTAD